ncbi:unnamed protein product [Sphenostylis stenocarpa]|uniref:Uncharacterized protein n=1 Tax=Sphenostylis stenocarpa TaxID=92480 RepID=A0AA86VIR2_9FABA|nr:unnamed protein product [Sphenostylis stenocarpa]
MSAIMCGTKKHWSSLKFFLKLGSQLISPRPFVRKLKSMESDQVTIKDMKVQMASSRSEVVSGAGVDLQGAPNLGQGGLQRQPSMTKTNCLCSPTTHAGSFRCRLHRTPSLQRTKSMESEAATIQASIVDAVADANKDPLQ